MSIWSSVNIVHTSAHRQGASLDWRREMDYVVRYCYMFCCQPWILTCHSKWWFSVLWSLHKMGTQTFCWYAHSTAHGGYDPVPEMLWRRWGVLEQIVTGDKTWSISKNRQARNKARSRNTRLVKRFRVFLFELFQVWMLLVAGTTIVLFKERTALHADLLLGHIGSYYGTMSGTNGDQSSLLCCA